MLFTIVCSLLDLVVLVLGMGVEFKTWLTTIFPFYLISFYGLGYWILKKGKVKKAHVDH